MAYRLVQPNSHGESCVADNIKPGQAWYIEKMDGGATFRFVNWNREIMPVAKLILAEGTFKELYPTWRSIVLMCTGEEAQSPKGWE